MQAEQDYAVGGYVGRVRALKGFQVGVFPEVACFDGAVAGKADTIEWHIEC